MLYASYTKFHLIKNMTKRSMAASLSSAVMCQNSLASPAVFGAQFWQRKGAIKSANQI